METWEKRRKMKQGITIIAEESQRQREEKGYTLESDQDIKHANGELGKFACCYILGYSTTGLNPNKWELHFSSDDKIKDLAKAGALIAAEIDRLQIKKEKEAVDDTTFRNAEVGDEDNFEEII